MTGIRTWRWRAALPLLALIMAACGGSGSPDPLPTLPGILAALALEGDPAPSSGGGAFGVFPPQPVMDVADGGWAAFVAPIVSGTTPEVLYVAEPDGTLVRVYANGDLAPDAGTESILGFNRVWMRPGGIVVVHVTLGGGPQVFGLLSARVVLGAAAEPNDVLLDAQDMSAASPVLPGTLLGLSADDVSVADDGRCFALCTLSSGDDALVSAARDGSGLAAHVSTAAGFPSLPNFGGNVVDIVAQGADATGSFFAFVAEGSSTGGDHALYVGQPGSTTYTELAGDGDAIPGPLYGGGNIDSIHDGGPIVVQPNGVAIWKAEGDASVSDDVILTANLTPTLVVLARSAFPAPETGVNGVYDDLDLLNQAPAQLFPQFSATVLGSDVGITTAIYGVPPAGPPALGLVANGQPVAAAGGGGEQGATFPGLRQGTYTDTARSGSTVFANDTSLGRSVLIWDLRTGPTGFIGRFVVAADGDDIPGGGDTFAGFNPSAHTLADDALLFRAALGSGDTGIFRQGP